MARTPSAAAHEKVLDAAIELMAERGIEGTSMDAIAQLSGVSKATVYKHWKDKEALCIDVIGKLRSPPPDVRTGDLRGDLIGFVTHLARAEKSDRMIKIWPRIISYAVTNPNFGQVLHENTMSPRRVHMARILDEAVERGCLPGVVEVDFALDLLVGPIMHRRLMGREMPADLPGRVVDAFLKSQGAVIKSAARKR